MRQRRPEPFNRLERCWPLCFGMSNQEVILIDYLEKGITKIRAHYLCEFARSLKGSTKRETDKNCPKKVLFYQGIALSYESALTMIKLNNELGGFELIPHPPYFLDLTPYGSFLIASLKIWLGGKKWSTNEACQWSFCKVWEILFVKRDKKIWNLLDQVDSSKWRLCWGTKLIFFAQNLIIFTRTLEFTNVNEMYFPPTLST